MPGSTDGIVKLLDSSCGGAAGAGVEYARLDKRPKVKAYVIQLIRILPDGLAEPLSGKANGIAFD
jgi:hypothetical protein